MFVLAFFFPVHDGWCMGWVGVWDECARDEVCYFGICECDGWSFCTLVVGNVLNLAGKQYVCVFPGLLVED
jgi:hypothetical protein